MCIVDMLEMHLIPEFNETGCLYIYNVYPFL